jgi:hypothetical protein
MNRWTRFLARTNRMCRALALTIGCASLGPATAAEWIPGPWSPIIAFSGYTWFVKSAEGELVGPGPDLFSAQNVRVAADGLHLRVARVDERWHSAEIASTASFGYGRYSFVIGGEVADLDPSLVLGLFTWSDDPGPDRAHHEIDIEISRWGDPQNQNAQCVVQPYTRPGAVARFELPRGLRHPTLSFTWAPDGVTCEISGAGPPGKDQKPAFRFTRRFTSGIPVPGGERARINLWQLGGQAPASQTPQEIVISRFSFTPLSQIGNHTGRR